MSIELLKLDNITKSYETPDGGKLEILKGVNLILRDGESIAIMGQSGSGKTTLLNIAALLLKPSSGHIYYSGEEAKASKDKDLSKLRNKYMGFVFQSSMLLEDFTILENVAMPLLIRGEKKKDALETAAHYLDLVNLGERRDYRPSLLSGGERQRVSIARALSASPSLVFADEPTGNLDEETSSKVEDLLFESVRKEKKGMVVVTHNPSFASKADKTYILKNGVLYEK